MQKTRLALLLCVLACPAPAALVAAQQSCAALGAFNFYPDGTINQPEAWTLANQGAAGNADRGALFPIALLGTPQPALNFLPSHPLLTAAGAAAPPAACATIATAPSRRLAAAAPAGAIAGTFSWSVALDGALSASGSAVTLAAATATPPSWTANVWGLADGKHELNITVIVLAGSAITADGVRAPATDVIFSQSVVFYKLVQRPTLALKPLTCSLDLTLEATDMWPEPVAAPGGAGALWKPVYHVWGKFVAGLDGQPYTGEDAASEAAQRLYFDLYWIRTLGSPNKVDVPVPNLADGTYQVFVEGSLTSDFPSLLSLAGNDTFNQQDTDPSWTYVLPGGALNSDGASLRGAPKFAGALAWNGTLVGVQSSNTTLLSFNGPDAIQLNEYAAFTWQYQGLGNATCAIDGARIATDPSTGLCSSPLLRLVNDTLLHTLVVTFRDACGAVRSDYMNFSVPGGWVTNATADGLPVTDYYDAAAGTPLRNSSKLSTGRNGAAGVAARGLLVWAGVALAVAVAAVL